MGLGVGLPIVIGDMDTKFGYGASFTIQKAFGHVFSLRFQAIALETFGMDHRVSYQKYANYKTRFSDYSLQGVFTLNNLNFYKKEPKVIYNLIGGLGFSTTESWYNRTDENGNKYNFSSIPKGDKKVTYKALNDLLDNSYETIATKDPTALSIGNTSILPSVVLGAGVSFKLSKTFDLNLDTRMSFHFTDKLDGHYRGRENDWMSFSTLGISYKFPSKTESMLWTNPVYSNIEEIAELKKKVNDGDLLKDIDKDGIADIFDQDLNTPAKVAVDSRGIPADMDKDGVPDYMDAEPFTPIGAVVGSNGVAVDTDNDGVADILDRENNTAEGKQVDANGRTIETPKISEELLASLKENNDFDLIFFDVNSSSIKKEFYSSLYKITRYIQANPTVKIQIIGHTDIMASEDFNMSLSEKRANAVFSMLIELFNVPSKNLSTKFVGENEPLIGGLEDNNHTNKNAAYYINRRVAFKIFKIEQVVK